MIYELGILFIVFLLLFGGGILNKRMRDLGRTIKEVRKIADDS